MHQPRFSIYELFDNVMILTKGDVAYHGPSLEAIDVFERLGYHCPEHENPADYLVDVIVSAEGDKDPSIRQAIIDDNQQRAKQLDFSKKGINVQDRKTGNMESVSIWAQFLMLTSRAFISARRNPVFTFVSLFQAVYTSLLLGSIYFQLAPSQNGIQNRIGVLFFIMIDQVFRFFPFMAVFVEVCQESVLHFILLTSFSCRNV